MRPDRINATRAAQLYATYRNWKAVGQKLAEESGRLIPYHGTSVAKAVYLFRKRRRPA